jgi:hypothetical protein
LKELQAVFPDQKPIDRTGLCSWDDQRVVDWVKQTGRKLSSPHFSLALTERIKGRQVVA